MASFACSRLSAFVVVTVCLALPLPAWAQKDPGRIVGSVNDQSGAEIAEAHVDVTDLERGSKFRTTTNASGECVVSPLRKILAARTTLA